MQLKAVLARETSLEVVQARPACLFRGVIMFSLQLPKAFASRVARPLSMLALTTLGALAAPGAALADSPWTSVGSTGVIDEACFFSVQLNNNEARLTPGMLTTCTVRYQVVDTYSAAVPPSAVRLNARILDNGAGARVDVRLRALPISYPAGGAAPTTLTTVSSDTTAPTPPGTPDAAGFRQYRSGCVALNFALNSYWIEVDLVRLPSLPPTLPGTPAVGMLNLPGC
jgi:hypothetical protein